MSAPIPLNSGCCSPPCPNNPQTAVPGPPGENAFSFTTANFTQPLVGANVTVSLTHDGWVVPGQTVFIQGGGFYEVASVSGLLVTLTNTGNTGNAAPGTVINSGAKISPGGIGGNVGNAFTTTTALFVQPAVSANVTVQVVNTNWMVATQDIYIGVGGYYTIFSVVDGTHVTVTNLGYPGNAAPATNIPNPQGVTPSGIRGATGATGVSTLNGISPTTTKGDLIVDNGANNPLASNVRFPVGTDGQVLAADSAQPTGIVWNTVQPNSVAISGDIAIYDGTTGKPVPLKDSKLLITADGAIQSTPSGGNARGTRAVDLQVNRASVAQVASGLESVICGGKNNLAMGAQTTVCGGTGNVASGGGGAGVFCGETNTSSNNDTFVGGGISNLASGSLAAVMAGSTNHAIGNTSCIGAGALNVASGSNSFVGAGQLNTASGPFASVVAGNNNTASGQNSTVLGGQGAVANLFGEVSHASFDFANPGDAQHNDLLWGFATTDATPGVEIFIDGTAVRAVLPNNTTWSFDIYLVGRSNAGVSAVWQAKGGIQNNAGTVTLVAGPIVPVVIADGTGGTWGVAANFAVTADNVNKSLKLAVTGAALTTIAWMAHARIVQVTL